MTERQEHVSGSDLNPYLIRKDGVKVPVQPQVFFSFPRKTFYKHILSFPQFYKFKQLFNSLFPYFHGDTI